MTEDRLNPVVTAPLESPSRAFTSDLSIDEFLLLENLGFEPVEFVMGTSVYHIGWSAQSRMESRELTVLTSAMYQARENAMGRIQAEADAIHADGVVGVRLEWRAHGLSTEHIEFIAVGTSVRYSPEPGRFRRRDGRAFTSHLSGQELYKLASAGYAPVAFVLGNCVYHVAQQGFMQTLRQAGRNVKMPQWTQAYYESRETAMNRMRAEVDREGAGGVFGVRFTASEWVWGAHTMEFYTSGTAVRKVGEAKPMYPAPVLSMS